ncbi:hypothetical protein [Pedobacter sp. UYP1]|uniref:hypothetical protein n=1 Tax=Pedobacter sp. UYP1 TaxID=1756396 RepID=UPI00339A5DE4
MKNLTKQVVIIAIAMSAIVGCKKGAEGNFERQTGAGGPFTGADSVISGNISVSRTLSPGKVYRLNGIVFVTNGAKLTIKSGSILTAGQKVNYKIDPGRAIVHPVAGLLVITRDASIDALGRADQPIIFTSPKESSSRLPGDFGGIVILGNSNINKSSAQVMDGLPRYDADGNYLGVDLSYGGTNATDNSGKLNYIRIEYAGSKLASDIDGGGLTLAGVGAGTEISHVQVSYSASDAFAFLGGTFNANYLLAIGAEDDDFSFTNGYTGSIQYAIGLKDPATAHSIAGGVSDSNGIESENDHSGTNYNPKTKPHLSNFTLLGYVSTNAGIRAGNRWRRNSDLSVTNSIIAGYNKGIEFHTGTEVSATAGGFTNNNVHAFSSVFSLTTAISLAGSTNFTSTDVNPDAFVGLGIRGAKNLNPFYSTAIASTYNINNLTPRILSSTIGAVLSSNRNEWLSGWIQFAPQTSID